MSTANFNSEGEALLTGLPRGNISDIIINAITDALIDGKLKPGDKIPTEFEFSTQLGVGRNVVREAIKVLEAFGVVEIRRSEGTYVTENPAANGLDPAIYGRILSADMRELIDLRLAMLNTVLFVAMEKGTASELRQFCDRAQTFRTLMNEPVPDRDACFAALESLNDCLDKITTNCFMSQLDAVTADITTRARRLAIENAFDKSMGDALAATYVAEGDMLLRRAREEIPLRVEEKTAVLRELLL